MAGRLGNQGCAVESAASESKFRSSHSQSQAILHNTGVTVRERHSHVCLRTAWSVAFEFPHCFLMANTSRRVPLPPQQYAAVPQSPKSAIPASRSKSKSKPRPPIRSSSAGSHMHSGRGAIAQGVATGAIGAGYGPYSVRFLFLLIKCALKWAC